MDQWSISDAILSLRRSVTVAGHAPGGFASSVVFAIDPAVGWHDVRYLAPGALYGDPTYDGERSAGGTLNDAARRFVMREDVLPAPLFALSFANGGSIALLDPSPRGDTTVEESRLTQSVMTDARFQFGALGARQVGAGPVELGFWFPGTVTSYGSNRNEPPSLRWFRRYHPIAPDTVHGYQLEFRFGQDESFRNLTRNAWRWAWDTLKPAVTHVDVELVRRVLTDHLVAQAATVDGRTAIPFVLSTVTDQLQWNWTMAAMGFVGKNIECADQLLREGDRDGSERGRKMRQVGLAVIASMIQALPTVPLQATGYDLATGKPHDHVWLAPWLRNATEDMRVLMRAYRRERALGREHPEWLAWVKSYVDWLLQQQRSDGSFPRRWKAGSNEIEEASGTTSYCPVPLLVMMTEQTGDARYQQAAIRAAEFVWSNWGERGLFIGGASDNPNITDKEAGMLGMEAFLSLYDSTREPRWLERAQAAANFAESWIWIWNLPMPLDADDAQLHWKKGVPTIGLQGITALGAGGADEYLDWAVPSYAKLYKETEGLALPRRGSPAPARHEVDAGAAWTSLRPQRPRLAAGALAPGTGRPRPGRRVSPVLAALGVRESPLRHQRARGVRPGAVQDALAEAMSGNLSRRRFLRTAAGAAAGVTAGATAAGGRVPGRRHRHRSGGRRGVLGSGTLGRPGAGARAGGTRRRGGRLRPRKAGSQGPPPTHGGRVGFPRRRRGARGCRSARRARAGGARPVRRETRASGPAATTHEA